jgi:hypothetical protein
MIDPGVTKNAPLTTVKKKSSTWSCEVAVLKSRGV